MGTRPQCLVNLMFFSLVDVGESAPSASGWTLTRRIETLVPGTTTGIRVKERLTGSVKRLERSPQG